MKHNAVEIITIQNEIIRMQSDVIDALFGQLTQHLTVQELDSLPVLDTINNAARLREDLRM